MAEGLHDRGRQSLSEITAELFCVVRFDGSVDDRFEVDCVGWWRVGLELLEHLGHPQLADAVRHGMVEDRPESGAPAFQSLDHHEPPQRSCPVERLEVQLGGEIEELAHRARLGQPQIAHVVRELELGIGNPRRRGDAAEARNDPFVESGHTRRGGAHRLFEVVAIGWVVEQRQRTAARIEPRVLLDIPHQRFGV